MTMKKLRLLCLLFLGCFTLNAFASFSCLSLLSTYQSKKIYTARELHSIEHLAAAILAARIGPDGYNGLRRHEVYDLEHLNVEAVLSNVTPEQRAKIQEQVIADVGEFFWNGRVMGLPIGKYSKVNFSHKNGYFKTMQHLVIGRDREMHQRLSTEIENFLKDSVDTIMVNASIMKHESRLV
jgi:predicted Fe-Mo cluster-binding NifX family protein